MSVLRPMPTARAERPATIRPQHPRLYFDRAHLARLRARWTDPAWADVVKLYRDRPDAVSQALQGLATGDGRACASAVAALQSAPKPGLSGPPQATWGDPEALVFDWCYGALPPATRSRLAHEIDAANEERERALDRRFAWHEAHYQGFHAYLLGALAVEGEPGIPSRLASASAALANWTTFANELHGDGTYKTYSYQDVAFVTPALLFDSATKGGDAVARNRFIAARPEMLLRILAPGGKDFWPGPGDQAVDADGFLLQKPAALAPALVAGELKSRLAAYAAETIRRANGWSSMTSDPVWLELGYADPGLRPENPAQAGVPKSRFLSIGGFVNFRSGWDLTATSRDVSAWFYVGPRSEHAESDAGHLTIVRGRDDLLTSGANYLGSPSRYRDLLGGRSFARNTAVFSPTGSQRPDSEGSQLAQLPPAAGGHRFPAAWRLSPGAAGYQGEITDFRDDGGVVMATGDATPSYDPAHVRRYRRSVAYVPPGLFVVRDAFALDGVDRVRMVFHTRERPALEGARVVKGSAEAGILESPSHTLTVARGDSVARFDLLTPARSLTRLVGGRGFDQYIDGENVDPVATAQDWLRGHKELPTRAAFLAGQWRTEFETSAADAGGEMIAAIVVSGRGEHPSVRYATRHGKRGTVVEVDYAGRSYELRFPNASEERAPAACSER